MSRFRRADPRSSSSSKRTYDEKFLRDNESRLDTIAIPVRIVWGSEDTWIPVERAHRLQELIPDSTLAVVPSSSHLMHYDQPVALMHELADWLP